VAVYSGIKGAAKLQIVQTPSPSLQPDAGEGTSTGMRQKVDIRYVVTSLKAEAFPAAPERPFENGVTGGAASAGHGRASAGRSPRRCVASAGHY
jgi:hypothetical protein